MKNSVREVFKTVFVWVHTLAFLDLFGGGIIVGAFANHLISGSNEAVHYAIVLVMLGAPPAFALVFSKPIFPIHRDDPNDLPIPLATLSEAGFNFRTKLNAYYQSRYTAPVRIFYGLFSLLMFFFTANLLPRVFALEVGVMLALNALFVIFFIFIFSLVNWAVSRIDS